MNTKRKSFYIENVIKNYVEQAQQYYPALEFKSRRSTFGGEEPTNCIFQFRFKSDNLNETEYHCKKNFDLIHYTPSIQNVIEILNSGVFRLTNLLALNDPQEFSYTTKNLGIQFTEDQIQEHKRSFFSASFCKVNNISRPDEFPMWRLYGGDGWGASIVFGIENFGSSWSNFLLAKVQYGEGKAVERIKKFMNFHQAFQLANNHPILNLPTATTALMALHKNKIWQYEKEIRLLTHYDFDKHSLEKATDHLCDLKHTISKNGVRYSYVELPFLNSSEYKRIANSGFSILLEDFIPILKIKKIVLGYNFNHSHLNDVREVARHLSKKYNHPIGVELSHLKTQMS